MVSYWRCPGVNTLVLCSMCATLCITVAIQQCNTFDFKVHSSLLAIQVRVVYFAEYMLQCLNKI